MSKQQPSIAQAATTGRRALVQSALTGLSVLSVLFVLSVLPGSVAAGPVYPPGNIEAGKSAFNKCAECHQVGPSARAGFGPQLNGIIGRPAASTADFRYSSAMKNSHIVWTEDKLRAFLKGPSDLVPGTKMRFWGIGDEQQISNLLAYLKIFP